MKKKLYLEDFNGIDLITDLNWRSLCVQQIVKRGSTLGQNLQPRLDPVDGVPEVRPDGVQLLL